MERGVTCQRWLLRASTLRFPAACFTASPQAAADDMEHYAAQRKAIGLQGEEPPAPAGDPQASFRPPLRLRHAWRSRVPSWVIWAHSAHVIVSRC